MLVFGSQGPASLPLESLEPLEAAPHWASDLAMAIG